MNKWEYFTKEQLQELWYNSLTKKEFSLALGYKSAGHVLDVQQAYSLLDEELGKNNPNKKKYMIGPKGTKIEDLRGKKFGHWSVIDIDSDKTKQDYKHSWWICECDCNKKTICSITMNNLKRGNTLSCGCNLIHAEEVIGKRYGKLVVISVDNSSHNRRGKNMICKCDCGQEKIVCCADLKAGKVLSCGCLGTSVGEFLLEQLFINNSISYEKQVSFPDLIGDSAPLRFDFRIIYNDISYLIEFQGEQHYHSVKTFGGGKGYEKQKRYDVKKREYCKRKNIKLIEIPYWDKEKINLEYIKEKLNEYYN